jgi:hypothetical protein
MKAEVIIKEVNIEHPYAIKKVCYGSGMPYCTIYRDDNNHKVGVRFDLDGLVVVYGETGDGFAVNKGVFKKWYSSDDAFGIALHEYRTGKGME